MIYRRSEYSFDFIQVDQSELLWRKQEGTMTPITIDTLQIEIAVDTGLALYAWGYYPNIRWTMGELQNISSYARPGTFCVEVDEGLYIGEAISYVEFGEWNTVFDPHTGWACIGNYEISHTARCIEFASNTVAVIDKERLEAIWLHPLFE
jgi:hypothetical protein